MTTYYVLCVWDAENKDWFDEVGHYDRADCVADAETYAAPKTWQRILHTDGTSADLIAKRDALAPPKGQPRA
jgi:hypothetical protein